MSKPKLKANYLKFGSKKVPMTDKEKARLEEVLDQYTKRTGNQYGFVFYLLGGSR